MPNLLYFELAGNAKYFYRRVVDHQFDLLMADTRFGLAGLGDTHSLNVLIDEIGWEREMEFRLLLSNPTEESIKGLVALGKRESEIRSFVMRSQNINPGDLVVVEKVGSKCYVIDRPWQKRLARRNSEAVRITTETTELVGEVGKDFRVEDLDFCKFAF